MYFLLGGRGDCTWLPILDNTHTIQIHTVFNQRASVVDFSVMLFSWICEALLQIALWLFVRLEPFVKALDLICRYYQNISWCHFLLAHLTPYSITFPSLCQWAPTECYASVGPSHHGELFYLFIFSAFSTARLQEKGSRAPRRATCSSREWIPGWDR